MSRVYLVEITAKVDALGTTEVLRYSDMGYTTLPSELPANAHFEARLKQPALVRRDMFRPGTTYGESQVGIGELVLANQDGGLDYLADYGFDGQQLRLLVGDDVGPYSAFVVALVGTMDSVEVTQRDFIIRVRDRQAELREPIQALRYAGTGDLEGSGLDIKGRVKPLVFGKVFNVIPVTVNSNLFIHQVASNPIADIPKVYDQGIELSRGVDYSDVATLLSVAPAAGEYRCFGGYFRLGSRPVGLLTCDAVESSMATDNTVGQVLLRLALQAGVDAGDVDLDSIDLLDLANSAECGLYVDVDRPCTECMDEVGASAGAYYGFDRFGLFRVGRLGAPGSPVVTLDEINIIEIEKVSSRDSDRGIPVYRVNLDYKRNYTLQDQTSLAAAVDETRLAELQIDYRKVVAEDLGVLNKHRLAPELGRVTQLIDPVAAQAEADRLLALYGVRREVFDVKVRLDDGLINLLDIGVTVEVDYYRFNLSSKRLLVIGLELDAQVNRASLTLWG